MSTPPPEDRARGVGDPHRHRSISQLSMAPARKRQDSVLRCARDKPGGLEHATGARINI